VNPVRPQNNGNNEAVTEILKARFFGFSENIQTGIATIRIKNEYNARVINKEAGP